MTPGDSAELQERMKRSPSLPSGRAPPAPPRDSNSWWMVGTAEYQVAPCALASGQKPSGLKRPGTTTVPPERKVDSVEATSPCTWNSGITHSETSADVSA